MHTPVLVVDVGIMRHYQVLRELVVSSLGACLQQSVTHCNHRTSGPVQAGLYAV